jgi:hypothetical protein
LGNLRTVPSSLPQPSLPANRPPRYSPAMTREPFNPRVFNFNPHGYTPDDVARWLLGLLRKNRVLPREFTVFPDTALS